MSLYLRLAWRNIWRHRRRTVIVAIAIAMTMSLMMVYDGLMAGFEGAIYANAIKVLGGNIQVHAAGYADSKGAAPLLPIANDTAVVQAALAQPQVLNASRRITTSGMVTNRKGAFGVSIIGIEPEKELKTGVVGEHVTSGRYLAAADQDVVFIGKGLADAMEVKVGDRIAMTGRDSHRQPKNRTMTVAGIYDLGVTEMEQKTLYIALGEAQTLYGLDSASEVVISLRQIGDEAAVIAKLRPAMPQAELISWEENFPELLYTIQTKTMTMNIFSGIILLVVGIGIFNLLLMAVFERTREIGLLGAMGVKPGQITWIFLLEGAMMALVGAASGVALGVLINLLFNQVGMDFSSFASMTQYTALITGKIYPTLGLEKLPTRVLTALIIALIASVYPANQAARHEPAQALHYV